MQKLLPAFLAVSALVCAQPVSKDAFRQLAEEWADPAGSVHCLEALRIFTEPRSDETEKDALEALSSGRPDARQYYENASDLPALLVTATKNSPPASETLFKDLKVLAEKLYKAKGGTALSELRHIAEAAQVSPQLALLRLLQTCDAHDRESYRMGYALDRNRLFAIFLDLFR